MKAAMELRQQEQLAPGATASNPGLGGHASLSPTPTVGGGPGSVGGHHRESTSPLKVIEGMLHDIGAPSPAATLTQQQQTAKAASKAVAQQLHSRDCLAGEKRLPGAEAVSMVTRRSPSPSSMIKGAPLSGKHRTDKMYLGKGFASPSSESPGPIYTPSTGFAEQTGKGVLFSKAPKPSPGAGSITPGPQAYDPPTSFGRQAQSHAKTSPSPTLYQCGRFGGDAAGKQFISHAHSRGVPSAESPAPGAYLEDILNPPLGHRPSAPSPAFGSGRNDKVFVSRAHVVDSLGRDSPGPGYDTSHDPRLRSTSAMSFGTSKRDGSSFVLETSVDDATAQSRAAKLVRHQEQAHRSTPGPGHYYNPDAHSVTEKNAGAAVFPGGRRELVLGPESDGPGRYYSPSTKQTEKAPKCATIGKGRDLDKDRDRFANREFLGRGIGEKKGDASPGPVYNPKDTSGKGPAYTIMHKERVIPKKAKAGLPTHARLLSRELAARENLGVFSPGPGVYNTSGVDPMKPELGGAWGPPPRHPETETHPSRGPSPAGKKPGVPEGSSDVGGLPNLEVLSTTRNTQGTVNFGPDFETMQRFMAEHKEMAAAERREAVEEHKAQLATTSVTALSRRQLAAQQPSRMDPKTPGFGKAERFGIGPGIGGKLQAQAVAASPGPGQYNANHKLTEKTMHSCAFGDFA